MGLLDKAKEAADKAKAEAERLARQHSDKIDKGIDKAAELAEKRGGNKQQDRISRLADKAKSAVADLKNRPPADGPEAGGDPLPPEHQ